MRETRKSNNLSQQPLLEDKKPDALQQAVDQEYAKLYRQTQAATRKTLGHILRHAFPRPAPQLLPEPSPTSTRLHDEDEGDDSIRTVSVTISDGVSLKPQKSFSPASVMPAVTSMRELIAFVPTTKNLATRGDLTGIPYLGDAFNAEDQKLINSISGESGHRNKAPIRKKKLDEASLEVLYRTMRSNYAWESYSDEQIIDAILHYHRDSTPRARLLGVASQNLSFNNHSLCNVNIDTCNAVDMDVDNLCIKPWCSRFCPRCYTYNCLLHNEKSCHLPLPDQFSLSVDHQPTQCGPTCYKHQREHLKRSLSPSHNSEEHRRQTQGHFSAITETAENARKRPRKSMPVRREPTANKRDPLHDENLHIDQYARSMADTQKRLPSQQLLTRIENRMVSSLDEPAFTRTWTMTDRSLFRLFYLLFDGDLCTIKQFFDGYHTCQDMYQHFISDAAYFSERISATPGKPFLIRQPYRRRMAEGATRAFLLHIKKHMGNTSGNTLKSPYEPCLHEGPCTTSNPACHCMANGTHCEKYCNCPIDCPHRFPGCSCKGACLLNNCLCCAEGRECDPDLCHKCGASLLPNATEEPSPVIKTEPEPSAATTSEQKTSPALPRRNTRPRVNEPVPARQHSLRTCRNVETSYRAARAHTKRSVSRASLGSNPSSNSPMTSCANISLQRKTYKQVLIAESDVAGYGAFLGSPVAYPGDLIAEYTGEIITEEEADRRGRLYDKQACSYLFNLDTKRCVDARQFGGKIRFANHSSKPNCVPKIKLVNGDYRIGIYAKQLIHQGEELFFEYMYDAHQRQQFVNNERVDKLEQAALTVLKRYGDNFALVRP